MWNLISKAIQEKGISAFQLAKMIGVPERTVYNWRDGRNKISFQLAIRVSDVLDIPLEALADCIRKEE